MESSIDQQKLKQIVEAALFAAEEPLGIDRLVRLFAQGELDSEAGRAQLRTVLDELALDAAGRGYELARVASGWRYQVRQELSPWISRLWEEKPPRYSRALLETLALIAYRQPVTRGDIEDLRGVAISQNIMRTLIERNWIRIVGEREVPGRPSLYGTTREFLDYFNLKSLDQLPPLPEIRALIETMVLEEPVPEVGARAPDITIDEADVDDADDRHGELTDGVAIEGRDDECASGEAGDSRDAEIVVLPPRS
jgi:segregation and condensation protein B